MGYDKDVLEGKFMLVTNTTTYVCAACVMAVSGTTDVLDSTLIGFNLELFKIIFLYYFTLHN